MWTWDISYIASVERGVHYCLYLIVDIWERYIVGWSIHEQESRILAADLLQKACLMHNVPEKSLVVHQDNGTPMTSVEFLSSLASWGKPSFFRPGVSDDNPYSESLFKHLEYNHRYPVRFETVQSAIDLLKWFEEYYYHSHRHSAIAMLLRPRGGQGHRRPALQSAG